MIVFVCFSIDLFHRSGQSTPRSGMSRSPSFVGDLQMHQPQEEFMRGGQYYPVSQGILGHCFSSTKHMNLVQPGMHAKFNKIVDASGDKVRPSCF